MNGKQARVLMALLSGCLLGLVAFWALVWAPQDTSRAEMQAEPPPASTADVSSSPSGPSEHARVDAPKRERGADVTAQAQQANAAATEATREPTGAAQERPAAPAAPGSTAPSSPVAASASNPGRASEPEERYELNREGIRDAVGSVLPDLQSCYEGWLKVGKPVRGKIQVHMKIEPDPKDRSRGVVTSAEVLNSELDHPMMEACLLNALGQPEFDAPDDPSGKVEVTYPFVFEDEED